MTATVTITEKELLHHLKLSGQLPAIFKEIATNKLIEQLAESARVEIAPEELQTAADLWRTMNKLESSEATFTWLKSRYLSLEDFEEIISNLIVSNKLIEYKLSDLVEPYFFQNNLEYTRATIYEVVLDDEDLAIELFYAIKEEEISFYDVARQYISDRELNKQLGYRPNLRRQDLPPEIAAAVWASAPSTLLEPIVTNLGIHLILVEEITKADLDEQLRSQILRESLFPQWIEGQLELIQVNTQIDF